LNLEWPLTGISKNNIQEVRGSIPLSSTKYNKGLAISSGHFVLKLYRNCIVGKWVGSKAEVGTELEKY